jgi:hypothetical protein
MGMKQATTKELLRTFKFMFENRQYPLSYSDIRKGTILRNAVVGDCIRTLLLLGVINGVRKNAVARYYITNTMGEYYEKNRTMEKIQNGV